MSQPNQPGIAVPVIEASDLTKTYHLGNQQIQALRGVSIRLNRGEFASVMGPSGSGKSTLMHLLGCLDTPGSGSYFLEGEDVGRMGSRDLARIRNERIGFVFQTFNLLPQFNALQNVCLPFLYKRNGDGAAERGQAALESVGLADRAKHRPSELSGGERQRVAIARALVTDPAIILADEPTGNLDSETGNDVMDLLARLVGDGLTLVVVTHNPNIARLADSIYHMDDGRMLGSGDPR